MLNYTQLHFWPIPLKTAIKIFMTLLMSLFICCQRQMDNIFADVRLETRKLNFVSMNPASLARSRSSTYQESTVVGYDTW